MGFLEGFVGKGSCDARITARAAAALKRPFTGLQRLDICRAFLTGRFQLFVYVLCSFGLW